MSKRYNIETLKNEDVLAEFLEVVWGAGFITSSINRGKNLYECKDLFMPDFKDFINNFDKE